MQKTFVDIKFYFSYTELSLKEIKGKKMETPETENTEDVPNDFFEIIKRLDEKYGMKAYGAAMLIAAFTGASNTEKVAGVTAALLAIGYDVYDKRREAQQKRDKIWLINRWEKEGYISKAPQSKDKPPSGPTAEI